MGQLATYVAIVDDTLRGETDSLTVGLLICKTKDNILAKYAVNAMNVPIGISEYELSGLIPEKLKGTMPTIEEIESEFKQKNERLLSGINPYSLRNPFLNFRILK
jgi:hypothetical protein